MNDTKKILRNWGIIWTTLAVILSVVFLVASIHVCYKKIHFSCEVDEYGDTQSCTISSEYILDLFQNLVYCTLFFVLTQLFLQTGIWRIWYWLMYDE